MTTAKTISPTLRIVLLVIQSRADFAFGFDEDHSSILKSSAMIDKLQQRMKDELNQLPSP
jgi:hypothetical protein